MQRVAIVGAGELGGALAHVVARRDTCRAVTLIDDSGRVAEGKALDIAQAAPVEGFATRVTGASDLSSAAGADAVVIADRAAVHAEWHGADALALVRQLTGIVSASPILCAGATQRDLVERSVRELKLSRTRVWGTAPEALAAAARALVALAINESPREVALAVLGVPPDHIVIPWEDATIGGLALTRTLDQPLRRRLASRVSALWPPGPHALAAAAWAALDAMGGRSRRRVSAFVAPDDRSGVRARTAAMPIRLSASGVAEVLEPTLTVVERVALENAMLL